MVKRAASKKGSHTFSGKKVKKKTSQNNDTNECPAAATRQSNHKTVGTTKATIDIIDSIFFDEGGNRENNDVPRGHDAGACLGVSQRRRRWWWFGQQGRW